MREPGTFEHAVLRELDQIREAFEKTVTRLEKRDEERDEEVSELKLQVGLLREDGKRNFKRDAGLVLAPTTLTAIITALVNMVGQPAPTPPPPMPAPMHLTAPGAP